MFLMNVHDGEYGVKPMNCPGHCYLFGSRKYSYRDLPIRYADFSRLAPLRAVRRAFRSDARALVCPGRRAYLLHAGAARRRARAIRRDDARRSTKYSASTASKSLCRPGRRSFSAASSCGTPPRRRCAAVSSGRDSRWRSCRARGRFTGPKIGFDFRDVLERSWTLATVQIDCAMPERFGLKYVTPEGTEATPVMIHRAVLGLHRALHRHSVGALRRRFSAVARAGAGENLDRHRRSQGICGARLSTSCARAGWRVEFDGRNEKLGYKIREAQLAKIPYAIVIGDKEVAARDRRAAPARRRKPARRCRSAEFSRAVCAPRLHKKSEKHRNKDHQPRSGGVLSLEKRGSIIKFAPVKSG